MADLSTTQSFNDGDQVTAAKMNNIIGNAAVLPTLITSKSNKAVVDGSTDYVLMYDGSTSTLVKATPSAIRNATGATAMPSSLNVVGNLSVNTNKATIDAATGDTVIAGTLASTGIATLSGTAIPASKTLVTTVDTQTLTNKTLSSPSITSPSITSPTITGITGDITASTSVINVGNGQIYKDASGNVGIGTTSPTSVLDMSKASDTSERAIKVQNSSSDLYVGIEGTSGNRFSGSSVNNVFFGTTGASGIEFATNNNVRMTINSSGNVGVGTASPASKLSVTGSGDAPSITAASGLLRLDGTGVTGFSMGIQSAYPFGTYLQSTNTPSTGGGAFPLLLNPLGGNVGVGTASPNAKLQVSGAVVVGNPSSTYSASFLNVNTGSNNNLFVSDNGVGSGVRLLSATDALGSYRPMDINGSTLTLNSASGGNVGIGITNPQGKLGIGDASTSCTLTPDTTNARFFIGTDGASALALGTNGGTKMTISSGGDIGMGVYPAAALHLRGAELRLSSTTSNTTGKISLYEIGTAAWEVSTNGAGGKLFIKDTYAAGSPTRMTITSAGSVGIGTETPTDRLHVEGGGYFSSSITAGGNVTAYSDERLKKNWLNLEEGFVDKLSQVKSGTYDRIDVEGLRQIGVSAQSVRSLAPEAVIEGADGHLSVAYGNLAMSSCVELAKEIVSLKKELESLRLKLAE